jgi:hypothetical protein
LIERSLGAVQSEAEPAVAKGPSGEMWKGAERGEVEEEGSILPLLYRHRQREQRAARFDARVRDAQLVRKLPVRHHEIRISPRGDRRTQLNASPGAILQDGGVDRHGGIVAERSEESHATSTRAEWFEDGVALGLSV